MHNISFMRTPIPRKGANHIIANHLIWAKALSSLFTPLPLKGTAMNYTLCYIHCGPDFRDR